MIIHFIEASHGGGGNWGKFMLARFELAEWTYPSALPEAEGHRLLHGRGWDVHHLLFVDLQTGEGVMLRPGGIAHADLEKHKIWVCPMAEPFLEWLYQQDVRDITTLPSYVELPEAPFAMAGYRRKGEEVSEVPVALYALRELVQAAVAEGVGDRVGAAIAHLALLCRNQGQELKL